MVVAHCIYLNRIENFWGLWGRGVKLSGDMELASPIHHRMPFIVSPQHYDWWMDANPQNTLHLSVLNSPAKEDLTAYAVSPRVNNARIDDADCIKPA